MECRAKRTGGSDELMHYGVLGMKWGVRRAIGKRAKIGATLERRGQVYKNNAVRALDKQQKLQNKRLEKWRRGDETASHMGKKEGKLFDQYVKNAKMAEKMTEYRNAAVKDLSEKDIQQGRRYIDRMSMLGGALVTGIEEARASKYIKEHNNK